MMSYNGIILRGDIMIVDLDPVRGSETGKTRPCVVISNDIQNKHASVIIIAIITEWNEKKGNIPICVSLTEPTPGILKRSLVHCGQLRTISKKRVKDKIGSVLEIDMIKVNGSLQLSLGLNG